MRVSVVIPTRDSAAEKFFSLGYVIKSLLWQSTPPDEIIVVEVGNARRTEELLAGVERVRVVAHPTHEKNPAQPRNAGASVADGDALVFLDDDTVLADRDALQKTVASLSRADFACGATRLWTSVRWATQVRLDQPFEATLRTFHAISFVPRGINRTVGYRDLNEFSFIGCYGVLRRDVFDAMSGFDTRYEGWGCEDTDLMMRLCLAGHSYELLGHGDVSVFHLTHTSAQADFTRNLQRFSEVETRAGRSFHVNHFFGVYEGDGYSLFSDL